MADIDYRKLAEALMIQSATKAVSSTPSGVMGHGPGGLFSAPGLSQQLFSAMILPQLGMASMLAAQPTIDTNPLYGIITGVTSTTGSEANGVCDDFPVAGTMKLCTTSLPLGRYGRETTVIDIDAAGKRTNRGEFLDLQVIGGPYTDQASAGVPTMPGMENLGGAARTEALKRLFELGVAFQRDFARQLYEGNPTNNTAGGGYKEFNGFDKLINTGYRDAETGTACAAADSIIQSFGDLNISTNGNLIVEYVTWMYRNLNKLAGEAGLAPASWVIAMPYNLFYVLTGVWPCAYATTLCTPNTGSTNFVSAEDQLAMRDGMRGNLRTRTGQYLLIDGEQVPVVLDDAIRENGVGAGTQESSIYFIPMTVIGGVKVTYLEYFDYSVAGGAVDFGRQFAPGAFTASDGGRFLWALKPPTLFCVQTAVKTEPRLVMRTPYLAARLTNVRYTPFLMPRSPFTDSTYFVNGGNTTYPAPSYYSPTS